MFDVYYDDQRRRRRRANIITHTNTHLHITHIPNVSASTTPDATTRTRRHRPRVTRMANNAHTRELASSSSSIYSAPHYTTVEYVNMCVRVVPVVFCCERSEIIPASVRPSTTAAQHRTGQNRMPLPSIIIIDSRTPPAPHTHTRHIIHTRAVTAPPHI